MPTRRKGMTDEEWRAYRRTYSPNPERDYTTRMKPKGGHTLETWIKLTPEERDKIRSKEKYAAAKIKKGVNPKAFYVPEGRPVSFMDYLTVEKLQANRSATSLTKEEYERSRDREVDFREPGRGSGRTIQDSPEVERATRRYTTPG